LQNPSPTKICKSDAKTALAVRQRLPVTLNYSFNAGQALLEVFQGRRMRKTGFD
jgi:hypothetical protein